MGAGRHAGSEGRGAGVKEQGQSSTGVKGQGQSSAGVKGQGQSRTGVEGARWGPLPKDPTQEADLT